MPKNRVSSPITDKEMKFAHLILAGELTDEEAAAVAGLKPSTADYVKRKPRVAEYMERHREAVQEKLAQHEAEKLVEFNISRVQGLQRLWELANLSAKETRDSISGQVAAMKDVFVQMGWDRSASGESETKPKPDFYKPAWLREGKGLKN